MQTYYIKSGIAVGLDPESQDYQRAEDLLTLYCFLFWAFGLIEFLIMFSGATMFKNSINLLQIVIHVAGIIALLNSIKVQGHYQFLAVICACTGFLPMAIEATAAVNAVG